MSLRTFRPEYRYYPVDEEWQRQACALMNVRFICPFERDSGDPEQILTLPNLSTEGILELMAIACLGQCTLSLQALKGSILKLELLLWHT